MSESSVSHVDEDSHEWIRGIRSGDAGTVLRLRMPENVLLDVLRQQDGYVWEVGYTAETNILIATDSFTTDLVCYQVKDEDFNTQRDFDDFFSGPDEDERDETASFTRTAVDVRIDVRTEETTVGEVLEWLVDTIEPHATQRALYEF